ncbi:alkaline phosphatase PhoX [Vibrio lentus]|uniref:alkaline phosphatase PhoX n=1 Tax=Vibrio lentus TaxID=136468 RepID=UPI003D124273
MTVLTLVTPIPSCRVSFRGEDKNLNVSSRQIGRRDRAIKKPLREWFLSGVFVWVLLLLLICSGQTGHLMKLHLACPNGCEVTGFTISPDYKSLFVNIQHPGNWPYSDNAAEETPSGMSVRPRAATVVIRREDGGEIAV